MPVKRGEIEVDSLRSRSIRSKGTSWVEPAKRVSFPRRPTTNQRNRRLRLARMTTTRMATSPRRSAIAMAKTISRYEAALAEILALDQSDASEIEQMRAPAASRHPNRQLRSEQQQYRGHRQRDGAEPIQPHRRQLFGAVGIWSGAGQQTPALAHDIAPRAASRRTSQQGLHGKMGPDPRAAFRQCCRHLALRDPKQQPDEIDAGKIRVHRFDQPRIAVDQEQRVAVIAQNIIDAQSAVPRELLSDGREVSAHLRPA